MLSVGVFSECVFCVPCVDVLHELWAVSLCRYFCDLVFFREQCVYIVNLMWRGTWFVRSVCSTLCSWKFYFILLSPHVCITVVWELCVNMLALRGHFLWAVWVDWHIPFHRKCCADSWSKEVIQLTNKVWLLCQSIHITYMNVQNAWEHFPCSSAMQIQLQNDCTCICVFDGGWGEGLHARF